MKKLLIVISILIMSCGGVGYLISKDVTYREVNKQDIKYYISGEETCYIRDRLYSEKKELRERQFNRRLLIIANKHDFKDIEYLKTLISIEKEYGLPRCELLAFATQENRFRNTTVKDVNDGKINYGVFQMRMPTAKTSRLLIVSRGGSIRELSEARLKNDRHYQAILIGGYLRELHSKTDNLYEVYAWYNAGYSGKEKFKSVGYKYSYSKGVYQYLCDYQNIMGEFYD